MPYDQRRGYQTQTTSIQHRQRSRRRIAAVSFLSNISLDGTHRDTHMRHFNMMPMVSSMDTTYSQVSHHITSKKPTTFNESILQSDNQKKISHSKDIAREESKLSSSSYKQIASEDVCDSNFDTSKDIDVSRNFTQTRSNQSSANSDYEEAKSVTDNDLQSGINIIVNKMYNPNINSTIGNLDSNSGIIRNNSKKSHVTNTLVRCANASQKVVTRVRSITSRGALNRNSIGASNSSIANLDNRLARSDKENIGPDLSARPAGHVSTSPLDWENIRERVPGRRRKLSSNPLVTSGGSDKGFSSCESIGGLTSVSRVRKTSSSVSESSSSNTCANTKEIKYLKVGPATAASWAPATWGPATVAMPHVSACVARQACEGRVLLTTGRGTPLHVFSLVRARCNLLVRSGEVGGPRKRNVSGSRHLATITDTTDPATDATVGPALHALPPPAPSTMHKTQEVSYSALLVSSVYFSGYKRKLPSDMPSTADDRPLSLQQQVAAGQQQQHVILGRCFSHDPCMSAQPCAEGSQTLPPSSHSQSAIASMVAESGLVIGGAGQPCGDANQLQSSTPHNQSVLSSMTIDKGMLISGSGGAIQPMAMPIMRSTTGSVASSTEQFAFPNYSFAPELLDDPELRAGKHRKLLRFPSYMTSLIDYAKPDELKREVNDKFRTKFPQVKITLSKLRSLKREMVHICRGIVCSSNEASPAVTMLTVAHAHAFFDCLCLSGAVEKTSRKPLAGACVMISAKVNDVKGDILATLIEKIECQLRLERSELMSSELTALLELKFSVHLPTVTVNTHYQRLLFEH